MPTEPSSPDDKAPAKTRGSGSFQPLGFLDALKTSWGPGRSSGARPATGTDAQARAVNYIDRRERSIVSVLGVLQIIGGVLAYVSVRHETIKASKKPKVSIHQAHLDTIHVHHLAIYILVINVVLGLGILVSVLSRRRALVGVMVLLGGFGVLTYISPLIGIVFLGVGGWLIFRGRKKQADAGREAGATRPARSAAKSAAAPAPATRKPPPPSRRYTPPQTRPVPAKKKDQPEEKPSRLPGWARR